MELEFVKVDDLRLPFDRSPPHYFESDSDNIISFEHADITNFEIQTLVDHTLKQIEPITTPEKSVNKCVVYSKKADKVKDPLVNHLQTTDLVENRNTEEEAKDSVVDQLQLIPVNLYQCNICQTTFTDLETLENHMRTHIDEKPYVCTQCSFSFYAFDALSKHCHEQHTTENYKFQCRFCIKTFHNAEEFHHHDNLHAKKPFDCFECGETYTSENELLAHKKIHSGDKPYCCNECDRKYSRSEDLNTHLRKHRGLPVFECILCERIFAQSRSYNNHLQKAHNDKYGFEEIMIFDTLPDDINLLNCKLITDDVVETGTNQEEILMAPLSPPPLVPFSDNNFKIPEIYSQKSVNTEFIRKFKCPLCELSFVKMNSLEIHCKRNHEGLYTNSDLKEIEESVSRGEIQLYSIAKIIPKYAECSICLKNFKTKFELTDHIKLQHDGEKPFKCSKCELTFARSSTLGEHVKIHLDSKQKCKYCGLSFVKSHSLSKHLLRHEGPQAMKCTDCQIPYTTVKDMEKHMRVHADGKPHKCLYCDKRFAQSCDKVKHMRIHTGERPFVCKVCGKDFAHLTSIKKHSVIHTGERPFQCSTCGKSFQHNCNLIVHLRTHTGERPYFCNICEKSFYTSGHYSQHMNVHTGAKTFECNVCEKKFLHQNSYHKHLKTHTNERPYHCTMCEKSFSQSGHFREHMRIHTGEKPYVCKICSKAFRRSDALNSHLKSHLKEKNKEKLETPSQKDLEEMKQNLESSIANDLRNQALIVENEKLAADDVTTAAPILQQQPTNESNILEVVTPLENHNTNLITEMEMESFSVNDTDNYDLSYSYNF